MRPILGFRLRAQLTSDAVRFALRPRFRTAIRQEFGGLAHYVGYIERKYGWFGTRRDYRAMLRATREVR